jgi:hypothetical protein
MSGILARIDEAGAWNHIRTGFDFQFHGVNNVG